MKNQGFIVVGLLLLLHALLVVKAGSSLSPTFDEPVHLAGGTSCWRTGDYRINPENGNLPQRIGSVPAAFDSSVIFRGESDLFWSRINEWMVAYNFFYRSGNDPETLIIRARSMMLLLSLALGICVYFISKAHFGIRGALISLALYVLSPTVLAHSPMVTSDISAALGFLLSACLLWWMLQRVTLVRVIFSGLALGILFVSKMSAALIVPVYVVLILLRLARRRGLRIDLFGWNRRVGGAGSQAVVFLGAGFFHIFCIMLAIWSSYGFRYSMLAPGAGEREREIVERNWSRMEEFGGIQGKAVSFFRTTGILPEAYSFGFCYVLDRSRKRYSFMNGKRSLYGWAGFFPYAFSVKTPLPVMLFLSAGCACIVLGLVRGRSSFGRRIYPYAALLVMPAVILSFAVFSNMNIGHRHILPLYPAFFVLAGASSALFRRSWRWRLAGALCLLWLARDVLAISPHCISYMNRPAGGPEHGYRHLADSSYDWGQDLKPFKRKLPVIRGTKTVYISYFGTASLEILGKRVLILPSYYQQPRGQVYRYGEGLYCISSTMLNLVYFGELLASAGLDPERFSEKGFSYYSEKVEPLLARSSAGNAELAAFVRDKGMDYWSRIYGRYELLRFAKLCEYLKDRDPDYRAGYSILIYDIGEEEIAEALSAPCLDTIDIPRGE